MRGGQATTAARAPAAAATHAAAVAALASSWWFRGQPDFPSISHKVVAALAVPLAVLWALWALGRPAAARGGAQRAGGGRVPAGLLCVQLGVAGGCVEEREKGWWGWRSREEGLDFYVVRYPRQRNRVFIFLCKPKPQSPPKLWERETRRLLLGSCVPAAGVCARERRGERERVLIDIVRTQQKRVFYLCQNLQSPPKSSQRQGERERERESPRSCSGFWAIREGKGEGLDFRSFFTRTKRVVYSFNLHHTQSPPEHRDRESRPRPSL